MSPKFYTVHKFTKYQCHCPLHDPNLVRLVVPAKFSAIMTDLRLAKILERQLRKRALKYTHVELKSIEIQENKFPRLI